MAVQFAEAFEVIDEKALGQVKSKILLRFGLGFGIGMVVIASFVGLEYSWLTSGERTAAQQALTAIDNLQTFGLNDENSDAQLQQTESAVEIARQAVRTQRDQKVAFALMQYLGSVELDRERAAGTSHLASSTAKHSLSLKLHETLD